MLKPLQLHFISLVNVRCTHCTAKFKNPISIIISNSNETLLRIITNCVLFFDTFSKIGLKSEAKWYLSKFSWGHAFLELNNELLERYSSCASSKEILEVQEDFLQKARTEKNDRRNQCDSLIPSDTSDDEEDDGDGGGDNVDDDVNSSQKSKEQQQ